MAFDILYASDNDNPGIYKVNAVSNFNHTLQVPGAMPKMGCRVTANVEDMEYELINSRKIKVNAVISLKGMVTDRETAEFVTDLRGEEIQLLRNSSTIEEFVGENKGQSIVKGKMLVDENKGEVKSILKTYANIHKKDISVQEGRVVVNACVLMRAMYDTTGGNNIYQEEQDVAFTHELDVPGIKPGMKCDVDFKIEDAFEEIREDENSEKRALEIEIAVGITAKAYMSRDIQNIDDAYSPMARYELEPQSVKTMSFFGEGTDNQTVKERISLPEGMNPINEIKHMDVNPILADVKVVDDKVVIEGVLDCCVMYLEASEEGNMQSHTEQVPFKSTVDVDGAKFDMLPEANANVEHLTFDKASGKEVDIKLIIECTAKVYARNSMDVVKSVEEVDMTENIKNMPSIIIYTVQNNDNLWKIAKKYSTTMEDIIKMNDMDNPENVQPGMKIIIPKKMFMNK
jgi:hypothetical protein